MAKSPSGGYTSGDREMVIPAAPVGPGPGAPSPWDRWIDEGLAVCAESGWRATQKLRAELAAIREAAIEEYGPLVPPLVRRVVPPKSRWAH